MNLDHQAFYGRQGAKARQKKTSAKRRREIARKAAKARWAKKSKKGGNLCQTQ